MLIDAAIILSAALGTDPVWSDRFYFGSFYETVSDLVGPALYVGGSIQRAGEFSSSGIARWGCAPCAGDADGDGLAGFADVLILLANWGPCAGCPEDLNGDAVIGFADVLEVLANWGPCP